MKHLINIKFSFLYCALGVAFCLVYTSCTPVLDPYSEIENIQVDKDDFKTTSDLNSVLRIFNTQKSKALVESKLYKNNNGDSVLLYKFDLRKYKDLKEDIFVTSRDHFLKGGKGYFVSDQERFLISDFIYGKKHYFQSYFYKSPTWRIEKQLLNNVSSPAFYLELEPHSWRVRQEFFVEKRQDFLRRIELEYFSIGGFSALLVSLILVLLTFAIIKKEYSVIFYVIYILCVTFEMLSIKGIGQQFLWANNSLFMQAHGFIYMIMSASLSFFVSYFYKFDRSLVFLQKGIRFLGFFFLGVAFISLLNNYMGWFEKFFIIPWLLFKLLALLFCIIHIVLLRKKILPRYLAYTFVGATFISAVFSSINPSITNSYFTRYLIINSRQLFSLLEVLVMLRFIFDSVIQTQQKYFHLRQININLKNSFKSSVLNAQIEERNTMMNDVHDSFGGYIEALKLGVNMDVPKLELQEILEGFHKEYRILLDSIYSPKIGPVNFKETLSNYFEKLKSLRVCEINYDLEVDDLKISKEYCIHLYRTISEICTNTIKHAKASSLDIFLSTKDDCLVLKISDDGIGFNPQKIRRGAYGLESVKKRISSIGGTLQIDSSVNEGTHFIIELKNE